MPGAFSGKDANQMEPITIHRVGSSVAILRTKTKPKSLELIGSDGKIYKYLLKAREDLRLDERIMQFLRVTNEFLGADGAAASRDLSAQSYNVIPLSRNAGLIQMVPDVVPLFQVYTSRNEQLANAGRAPQDLTASSSSAQQQPPLPTAQFYAKLKQHGIANVSPNHRAQWSVPVLKQVYQELVAQRPRNVLQQEILLRSEDLRESWVKNARLSKSVARGYRPYRSQCLFRQGTQAKGRFRVAFETTLRVVRSDDVREALLTLFEAFVYSPLVDWIADDKRQGRSGDLKARLEVNDIWMSLSAIKLSNAQGQRLLKLAGASWMIKTMDKLNGASSPMPSKATTLSTALKENQMFQFVVAVSHASMTLLDLVSTPKGSMKRLRANELMVGGYQTQREANQEANEGLRLFVEILQAMELFTMSFKEEIVLNLHRRGIDEGLEEELLDMIQGKIATAAGVLEVIDAIISPTTTDGDLILKTSLSHHQATLNMFAAAVDVIQKTSSYVDALRRTAVVGDERAKDIKNSARSNWIQLTLILIRRLTVDCETEEGVTELWSAHVRSFISDCQVELLQCQFSSIISHDWKFGFTALAGDIDKSDGVGLGSFMKQWDVFFSTHLADILPSTSINLPNGTPESQTGEVCNSVMDLMNACETWWSRRWRGTQSQSWVEKISSLRNRHERRIRYATWLATQPMHQTQLAEVPNLTRIQLLTVLSSQVPYFNALLTQQATIEASVLELAQQLDYFASSLHVDDTSNDEHSASESLHACVQNCYSKLTALFEYGRALADLVQGISVIETSTGEHLPETGKIELEVDAVGRSVLQSASKSTLDPHASNKALHEINTRVKALEDELKHRQASYAALVSRKRAAEIEFLGVCVENKDAVMETAQTLSKRVKEMRLLLKRFDKFKTPSKQNQAPSSMGSDNLGRPRQLQSEERATTGFCFMENDRLVKILLRSIRSVDHLQLLESVLEKHGETCTSLREAVTQLDQVLREYDAKADALLTASDHNPQDPSRASLLLQLTIDLIEALRVVEPPSGPARPVTADDTSTSLLVVARDLVRGCVKLFFEATEMADRLSSAEDEISRASGIASLPEDEAAEEQVESADDSAPLALESENSVTLPVSGDSGSSAHDTTASTPRSVEKKSQYGLQVLKRIEEKLSGTVTEMAQAPPVLTVEQQATWLIDEATKTDNLCVMYEGWTPWI
ncbi:hypothetical protein PF006_g8585 [Phytophthora fragariae]|uniref:Non-specific serine/threonine protein kinase n=1 Tax=Phytophthora fragariae TaxID=53985 RepID=A0A6A3UI11_9STRA|nr:hypothetical protein PF006_g8585 [Phytophthora fragariae]